MKTAKILITGLTVGAFALVTSCTPTQRTYGLGGAAAGAAGGALFGGDTDDIVKGAVLGGAAGTGLGVYKDRQASNRNNSINQPQPRQTAPPVQTSNYPEGYLTNTPGVVLSPYEPHNKVRVDDMKPGSLVRDPYNKEIFVVPN